MEGVGKMSIQWPLVIFTLLTGTGAGLMVFLGLAELLNIGAKARKLSGWVAAVLVVLGGIASVVHLGQPANVMSALGNLGSFSGISVELILLAIATVVAVIYAFVAKEEGSGAGKALGVIALIVGLVFCWSFGSSYMIPARPNWNTLALPLAYLGSGLTLGGFVYLALLAAKKEEAPSIKKIAVFVLLAALVGVIGILAFGIMAGSSVMVDNSVLFWAGAVVIGGIAPLVAAYLVWKNGSKSSFIYAGLAGALIGGLAFRALMWAVGTPAITNLFDVAANNRGLFPF